MSNAGSNRGEVEISGPDDAQEIVLVHGTIFNRTMWAPQREALSREFRILVPELPGHGTRADEPFHLETAIETLESVFAEETDGTAHLVGISLGGYVAMEFARHHPGVINNLILSSSSVNPVGLAGTASRTAGKATLIASKSDLAERAVDWLAERYVRGRELRPEVVEEIVSAGFDLRPYGEAGVEIAGEDFRDAFASFSGPALILNGKRDLLRLGERNHAEAKTDAQVEVIDGAGHVCNLDEPAEYTAAVDQFIRSTADVHASQ